MTFDIALSGLNAASTKLEVISHNIANNQTTGFKSGRVEFADVYAAASDRVIGQGVNVTNIRQSHNAGTLSDTGRALDLSITGNGYFALDDDGAAVYTRNGAFNLDREGHMVSAEGLKLQGYATNGDGTLAATQTALMIDPSEQAPQATSRIDLGLNLDATVPAPAPFDVTDPDSYNFTTATTLYDSLGTSKVMTMYFHKDTPNSWSMFSFVDGQEVGAAGGDELVFDADGLLTQVNGAASEVLELAAFSPGTGARDLELSLDLSSLSQYNSDFGVNQIVQDGYTNGRMTDLTVDESGLLFGRYSNGQSQLLGQVSLTNFANPGGLQQVNGTTWKESFASGSAISGPPGSGSLGGLRAGALEESNVDITSELVAMIGAQRSFQANAQVISTVDTITQTVINMRR